MELTRGCPLILLAAFWCHAAGEGFRYGLLGLSAGNSVSRRAFVASPGDYFRAFRGAGK